MENRPYHHGNLRNALIGAGLELINTEGEENLSLRKVALKCGVSNAAPYAHYRRNPTTHYGFIYVDIGTNSRDVCGYP